MKKQEPQEEYTRKGTREQYRQVRILFEIEEEISKDDPVRQANAQLEELNYEKLYSTESTTGRKSAVDAGVMYKIVVYGYMNGIYSSRKIEQACRQRLDFRWLLDKEPVPDHSTIARFRTNPRYQEAFSDLFYQYVNELEAEGETEHDEALVDGTKLESRANRYSFVWRKNVERGLGKAREKGRIALQAAGVEGNVTRQKVETLLKEKGGQMKEAGIERVKGKGKRKEPLQREVEGLEKLVEDWRRYDQQMKTLGEDRNSYSKSDPDATFMRMKEDHMRNGQLKPGYNVQVAMNSGYVTGYGVFRERNDVRTLIPFLEEIEKRHGKKYRRICADSGYESLENYRRLKENGQESYIKPVNYEMRQTRKYAAQIGRAENMAYYAPLDFFLCKRGQRLELAGRREETRKDGQTREVSYYQCEDCRGCSYRAACCKAKDPESPKELKVCWELEALRRESQANITTELGALLRVNRSIQCEGAFGHLKYDRGFTRFMTRGNRGVCAELCFLFHSQNLLKYISGVKGLRQRTHLIRPAVRLKS